MTYYHDILSELKAAEKPLTAKQLHERIGGYRTEVYRALKKVRTRRDVKSDRNFEENGKRYYVLLRDGDKSSDLNEAGTVSH